MMTSRLRPVVSLGFILFAAIAAQAADLDILLRSECATIASPVVGKTYCFDQTVSLLKAWDGNAWRGIGTREMGLFSIADYGATGNGSSNDTTAIQRAIVAAHAVRGGVLFPATANSYLCNGLLTAQNGVTLFSFGAQLTGTCKDAPLNWIGFRDGWLEFDAGTSTAMGMRSGDMGVMVRSLDANTQSYVAAIPHGRIAPATAASDFRVFGTDYVADATNFESFDMEAYTQDSPGYWFKTRKGGTGKHRPITFQIGGHNTFRIDPTTGAMATTAAGGSGASDYVFAGMHDGDFAIGRNGRGIRTTNHEKSSTYFLIGGDAADRVRIDSDGHGVYAGSAPKQIVYGNGNARAINKGTYIPGTTTPSVANGINYLFITQSGPTTISNFTDAEEGQVLMLFFADALTTIDRTNAALSGGVNFTSKANSVLVLMRGPSRWYEISRTTNNS